MGSHGLLLWVFVAFSSPSLSLSCSERQLDAAQMGFRFVLISSNTHIITIQCPHILKSSSPHILIILMMEFRDCMEEKKGRMLDMEAEEVGDIQGEICNGLKVSRCQH